MRGAAGGEHLIWNRERRFCAEMLPAPQARSKTCSKSETSCEKYPNEEPEKLLFLDLMNMVTSLEGFEGKKENCNERILEAIQATWIEEKD